jgi:hypothetical protein
VRDQEGSTRGKLLAQYAIQTAPVEAAIEKE